MCFCGGDNCVVLVFVGLFWWRNSEVEIMFLIL